MKERLSSYSWVDLKSAGANAEQNPCTLKALVLFNGSAAPHYVRVYDKVSPTQADTPVLRIGVGIKQTVPLSFPDGMPFKNGISIRCTTSPADNDTTDPATNDSVGSLWYNKSAYN